MRSFPLIRNRISNEHIMAMLFFVLTLYQLPAWIINPNEIWGFVILVVFSLLIDVVSNFIRFKKPVCAVSAAVTAGILQVLTPGIPLWGRLAGIAAALVIAKHIWGGTGKNIFNPAVTALVLLSMIFKLELPEFPVSFFLIPAVVLSAPFLVFRPFAGLGMVGGMALTLLLGSNYSIWYVEVMCIFFGCLIITDPVTSTPRPVFGFVGGILAGFIPYFAGSRVVGFALALLAFNLMSYLLYKYSYALKRKWPYIRLKIDPVIPYDKADIPVLDFIEKEEKPLITCADPTSGEILESIKTNEVYGHGGAAFPTFKKIRTVFEADVREKYLIINAVECDPGLIHDKWLVRTYPDEIYKGITAIKKCIALTDVFLTVKRNDGLNFPQDLKIIKIQDYYPAGAEKILIEKVLKRKIPEGVIPANEGILVLNVQTIYAIYQAVYMNKKADTKYITVSDIKNKVNKVARVKTGDKINEIINSVYPQSGLVFNGGGMMQSHMAEDGDIVDRSTNFIAVASLPEYKESILCSKCGLCTAVCPAGLEACRIAELVDAGELKITAKYHPEKCISCGSCSYVCLAGRNLSARVGEAKEFSIQCLQYSIT
jgi:Na+-translocating ferredoxin:NAD+ oxidoreductase subunit C